MIKKTAKKTPPDFFSKKRYRLSPISSQAGDRVGVVLALGLARAFDLLVVSDTAPPLGLFFCRFEIPKAARKTVSIAKIPEFRFMMKPRWCLSTSTEPLKPLT
jgi:hypothetical protein